MPTAVATWVATKAVVVLSAAGVSGTALSAAGIAVYAGTYAAVTVGVAYASQALLNDTPDSGAAQGSMRQPIPARLEGYGYGRLPGQYLLWEAKANYAYDVVAFHHGKAQSIDEIWSHDHKLTIGAGGWVTGSAEYGGGANDLIHVEVRLGLATETAYSAIVAALGGSGVWTNNHRGDGIATLGADYHHAKKENLLDDFPNGDPSWSAVGNWKPILDPRTGGVTASRNTAVQILDLLISATGFDQDYATTIAPVLDHWKGEMDICDEAVPLKAGGSTPRYQSFTYRALSDDPADCLNKLLAACDGKLLTDENGCFKLWVGKDRTPTVFLTDEDIHGYEVAGDADPEDVVNEILPRFKSPAHKWNVVETDAWLGDELGGETQSMDLEAVTNNSQARRLAKAAMARQATEIRGRLDCKLSAARAMGERWIGVDLPELGLANAVIEVENGAKTSLSALTVSIPFSKADPNAYNWSAATEEGDGPQLTDRLDREVLGTPTIDTVTSFFEEAGSGSGVRLSIDGDGPDREDLTWFARWRVTGSTSWVEAQFTDAAPGSPVLLTTGFVTAEETLDVQIAYQTGGGTLSDWSATETVVTATPMASLAFPAGPFRVGVASANQITGLEGWTYARAGAATGQNADGSVVTFAADVGRITDRGLLIESAATNPLLRSQEFDNAVWDKGTGGSVTANTIVAPDGTTTADEYTWPSGTATYAFLSQTVAGDASAAVVFSVWMKITSGSKTVRPRLSDVTLATTGGASITLTTAWQRVALALPAATLTNTGSIGVGFASGSTGTPLTAGDVVHIWGAQIDTGTAATSYIPTAGAAATRAADTTTLVLPAGSSSDPITVVHSGGTVNTTRAALANPLLLDLGGASGGGWVGHYIETVTVSPA